MRKKSIFVFFFVSIVAAVLSPAAPAQSYSQCLPYISEQGTFDRFAISCTPVAYVFAEDCGYWSPLCRPSWAPNETRSCNCIAGQPIDLATGNTYIKETDLRIPGLGGGLALTRTWNSMWPSSQSSSQVGLFGPNWRSTYEERVFPQNGYLKYARSDGSFWSFLGASSGWTLVAPANTTATLVQGSSAWILTLQNGEQRQFDLNSGNLTAIIDRNGNTTQVAYDSIGRLSTVTDPAARHIYFSYQSNSSYLITSVTTDFGPSLTYTYDSQGRLLQVTNPDQSTLNFSYDINSNIASVTDTNGKVLEAHTYDSLGRGLTSSRANGVDAVTVAYPQQ